MSGSSLCCDARKLNMSNVAFLVKESGKIICDVRHNKTHTDKAQVLKAKPVN